MKIYKSLMKIRFCLILKKGIDYNYDLYYNSFFYSNLTKSILAFNKTFLLDIPNFKYKGFKVHVFVYNLSNQLKTNKKINKMLKQKLREIK